MLTKSVRSSGRHALLLGGGVVAAILVGLSKPANALPTGGTVAAGTATIVTRPGQLTVKQTTQNTVIDWQSFGIAASEAVTFVQPSISAVALNRVVGQDPSAILGSLTANGRVFVVNPNGVLFGQGAQVNVAGLVASTLNITDGDFMAGTYRFSGAGGGVVNRGTIMANSGFVALLGARVSNTGLVSAQLGTAVLAAGAAVTLDVTGNGLLSVVVDRGAVGALAQNGGIVRADGGQVIMTANAVNSLIRTVVNNTGVIEARSVGARNGVIMLLGTDGTVDVAGSIDASGRNPSETGGRIVVTGSRVALGTATIDASGDAGGGTVLLGGGYRGQDSSIANATTLDLAATTTVRADALASGTGGTVVAWSNGATTIGGTISARGSATGAGGLVETSGTHVSLASTAFVDTRAAAGAGLWLLDPVDYKIAIAGGDETPSQVTISLASSNRLIVADHNITVADAVTWTTPQTLELRAGNDVLIDAAVTASTAGSKFIITAGHDAQLNAAITASALGSQINVSAGHDIVQNEAVTASAGGSVLFVADADGSGGLDGGTVRLSPLFPVTSTSKTIYYSPEHGYGAPNDYTGFTAYMWVFAGAKDKVYDGTVPATLTFRSGDPTVGGAKDVRLTGGTANFNDPNVGTLKPVTFSGVGLAGADEGAYALFQAAGVTTASITPAALTVTANNAGKTYGQTLPPVGTAFTSTGLVNGETIGLVTLASPGAPATAGVAGSPYPIVPSNATGGTFSVSNYNVNYVNGVLSVAPAALTITADNAAKTYGDVHGFTGTEFTAAGLQNGDAIGSATLVSAGTPATATVAGGPYAIVPTNATGSSFVASNYTTTYVNGMMTVTPASLVIAASDVSKTYGDIATLSPAAFVATGLKNGDTVGTFTPASVGAVSSATVAGGPYPITGSGAGGGTYTPANYVTTYVDGTLTVVPAALTITANDATKTAGTALSFAGTEFTSTGLKNGDTVAAVTLVSSGTPTAAASGAYAIDASNAAGGTYVASNYATTYTAGTLAVTEAPTPTPTPTPVPVPAPTPVPPPAPLPTPTPGPVPVPSPVPTPTPVPTPLRCPPRPHRPFQCPARPRPRRPPRLPRPRLLQYRHHRRHLRQRRCPFRCRPRCQVLRRRPHRPPAVATAQPSPVRAFASPATISWLTRLPKSPWPVRQAGSPGSSSPCSVPECGCLHRSSPPRQR